MLALLMLIVRTAKTVLWIIQKNFLASSYMFAILPKMLALLYVVVMQRVVENVDVVH
jgi:hypothetical protein